MYKAIIFDFFDVIHRDPFRHWLKQSGLERNGDLHETSRLLDIGAISDEEFYKRLSESSGQPSQTVKVIYEDTTFIDYEMIELIKRLKHTYKTGLLSNSSIEYLRQIIRQHELEALFDVITVSAEVRLIKPDPKIFAHILDKLGVPATEAIFIDDNPKNVEAAAKLGIESIIYKEGIEPLKKKLGDLGVSV